MNLLVYLFVIYEYQVRLNSNVKFSSFHACISYWHKTHWSTALQRHLYHDYIKYVRCEIENISKDSLLE